MLAFTQNVANFLWLDLAMQIHHQLSSTAFMLILWNRKESSQIVKNLLALFQWLDGYNENSLLSCGFRSMFCLVVVGWAELGIQLVNFEINFDMPTVVN